MKENQTPRFPLIAELNDLANCLNQLGEKPLKLIAEKVYRKFNEVEWDTPKWSFVQNNGIIEHKKLLSNVNDTFQFSIANSESKQDFHVHKIEISYIMNNRKETMQVSKGVLIVPPGVVHKIKLHGITFVFQASSKGSKVHEDKHVRALKF
jgi:hypothetical protein